MNVLNSIATDTLTVTGVPNAATVRTLTANTGVADSTVLPQGSHLASNSAGGSGSCDLINEVGSGGERAFNFFTSDGSGSSFSVLVKPSWASLVLVV